MRKLCAISDLYQVNQQAKLRAYKVRVSEQNYLVINKSDVIYLYKDLCPHQQRKLSPTLDGLFDESLSLIHCEHHHAYFTLEQGLCIRGPCREATLEKVDFVVNEGWIYLT